MYYLCRNIHLSTQSKNSKSKSLAEIMFIFYWYIHILLYINNTSFNTLIHPKSKERFATKENRNKNNTSHWTDRCFEIFLLFINGRIHVHNHIFHAKQPNRTSHRNTQAHILMHTEREWKIIRIQMRVTHLKSARLPNALASLTFSRNTFG